MNCIPCRLSIAGTEYEISRDGTVRETWLASPGGTRMYNPPLAHSDDAKEIRREASRRRRNRVARQYRQAMKDMGLTHTPYGWE